MDHNVLRIYQFTITLIFHCETLLIKPDQYFNVSIHLQNQSLCTINTCHNATMLCRDTYNDHWQFTLVIIVYKIVNGLYCTTLYTFQCIALYSQKPYL
jgi:hypothetical protein